MRLFPRELLSVRRRGDEIAPQFAPVDEEHLALAQELIDVFRAHEGKRRGALMRAVEEHELRLGPRYKLARGLATLLERRSAFEVASRVDPSSVRRVVFEQSARLESGAATRPEARARVLEAAAPLLGLSPEEVERALWADTDENLVLVAFDAPEPEVLLRRYNLGLAQTLLFDAVRMEVTIEENFRNFLGLVKLQGLMHVILREPDGTHRIVLDGPVSLFRDTRRYGTALAKALPGLAGCGRWSLRAQVLDPYTGRERTFRADPETLPMPHSRLDDEEAQFDSSVERRFSQAWKSLHGPWRLLREPAAVQVEGGEVFLPDFGFAWGGGPARAYLEVVGFWTPEYLRRKLEKVRKLPSDISLLLAVDQHLGVAAEDFADAPVDVLFYKNDVPLVEVTQWLKRHEETLVENEAARVRAAALPDAPVVTLADLARAHDVSAMAVERALAKLDLQGRVRVGDALVARAALREIEGALEPGMGVAQVEAIARKRGITDTSSLLSRLGYSVAWRGLDPSSATIQRK